MVEKIEKVVKDLDFNLSVLQLINKYSSNNNNGNIPVDNLNFGRNSILKLLESDCNLLTNYCNQNNQSNKELNIYLVIIINSLQILFDKDKNNIDQYYDQTDKCRNEISKFLNILKRYKDKTPYEQFIINLGKIYTEFKNLNNETFLKNEELEPNTLINYEQILEKYKQLIENLYNLNNEIYFNNLINLYMTLNTNYEKLMDNLKSIYLHMLENNKEYLFVEYYKKCKELIENGHFKSILESQFISKEIFDNLLRNKIKLSITENIDNLNKTIESYRDKKDIDKFNSKQNYQEDIEPSEFTNEYEDNSTKLSNLEKKADDVEKDLIENNQLTFNNLGILKTIRSIIGNKKKKQTNKPTSSIKNIANKTR